MRYLRRLKRQARWKLRVLMLGFFAAAIALTLSACGNNGTSSRYPTANSYGHDGYLGLTNSNPNLPNRVTYLNMNTDSKLVQQVLAPIKGIQHVRLNFNGNKLHVDVTAEPSVSAEDMVRLQAQVLKVVQFNMPRYDVDVKVSK